MLRKFCLAVLFNLLILNVLFSDFQITSFLSPSLSSSLIPAAHASPDPDWLSGWQYRKNHTIQNATGAGTSYQVRIRTDFIVSQGLLVQAASNEPELGIYGVRNGELYFGLTYQNSYLGHLKKVNLSTGSITTFYTGNRLAAWQGFPLGSYVWTGGEERDAGDILRACIARISSDDATVTRHPNTGDCNEFIGIATNGTHIVVGERAIGGLTTGSNWPNGGGLWVIPFSTWTETGTWSRIYEDTSNYEWISITKFGSTWYAMLRATSNSRWKIIRSTDLTTWTVDLDYTTQTTTYNHIGIMINASSKLAALAPVATDSKYHMFVLSAEGGSWSDYTLNLPFPSQISGVPSYWDSPRSKVVIFLQRNSDKQYNIYQVDINGSNLTQLYSNLAGIIAHLHPKLGTHATVGSITYYPISYYTSVSSYIGWLGTEEGAVSLSEHCRTDFGDVRFTDDDGTTELDYWIEEKVDSEYAIFWVEVKDDLSSEDQTIYVYYGKSDATTTSNGENTFIFFDNASTDKSSSYTLRNLYNPAMSASLSYDSVNDKYDVTFTANDAVGLEISGVSGGSFEVWMKGKITSTRNQQFGVLARYSSSYCWWLQKVCSTDGAVKQVAIKKEPTPPSTSISTVSSTAETNYLSTGTWYQVKGHAYGTSYWVWCEHEDLETSGTSNDASGTWGVLIENFIYSVSSKVYFKDVVVRKYVDPEPAHGSWGSEEQFNNPPTNDSGSITNMNDGNNLYAQKRWYTGSSMHSDLDGFADIDYCEFRLKQGATTRAIFRYDEDTDTFTCESGSDKWDLDTSGSSATESGNTITVTWKFKPQWDSIEESDLEIELYVVDDEPESDTDIIQSNYVDVVVTLTISGFASIPEEYVNPNSPVTFSGTVYYVNDPGSSTASSSYPPDAEFTKVVIHNSTHVNVGQDTTIVNGAFSCSVTSPATVGQYTYHPFLDMADADYPDSDVPGISDTITVVEEYIKVMGYSVVDDHVNVKVNVNIDVTLKYESDLAPVIDGSVTINGISAAHQGSGVWRITQSKSTAQSLTYNNVAAWGNSRGVTNVNQNGQSQTVIWDGLNVSQYTVDMVNRRLKVRLIYAYNGNPVQDGTISWLGLQKTTDSQGWTPYYDLLPLGDFAWGQPAYGVQDATYGITAKTQNQSIPVTKITPYIVETLANVTEGIYSYEDGTLTLTHNSTGIKDVTITSDTSPYQVLRNGTELSVTTTSLYPNSWKYDTVTDLLKAQVNFGSVIILQVCFTSTAPNQPPPPPEPTPTPPEPTPTPTPTPKPTGAPPYAPPISAPAPPSLPKPPEEITIPIVEVRVTYDQLRILLVAVVILIGAWRIKER